MKVPKRKADQDNFRVNSYRKYTIYDSKKMKTYIGHVDVDRIRSIRRWWCMETIMLERESNKFYDSLDFIIGSRYQNLIDTEIVSLDIFLYNWKQNWQKARTIKWRHKKQYTVYVD